MGLEGEKLSVQLVLAASMPTDRSGCCCWMLETLSLLPFNVFSQSFFCAKEAKSNLGQSHINVGNPFGRNE